jgi:hypothetical protein
MTLNIFLLSCCIACAFSKLSNNGNEMEKLDQPAGIFTDGTAKDILETIDMGPVMNCDFDTPYSKGEYETQRRARFCERDTLQCLVQCDPDDVTFMAVYVPDLLEDSMTSDKFVNECLILNDNALNPKKGIYCLDKDQKTSNGTCKWNAECLEALESSDCTCSDLAVRYACSGSPEQHKEFCDEKIEKYENERKVITKALTDLISSHSKRYTGGNRREAKLRIAARLLDQFDAEDEEQYELSYMIRILLEPSVK